MNSNKRWPKMVTHGKKVISLLDNMYQSNDSNLENPAFRGLASTAQPRSVSSYAEEAKKSEGQRLFEFIKPPPPETPLTTRVQYDALNSDLDRVRARLKRRSMSAKAIGERTFKYFLEKECQE
ncbi:hypothetical protein ACFLZM_08250 [Thermodesulfobacteriota bacterium]